MVRLVFGRFFFWFLLGCSFFSGIKILAQEGKAQPPRQGVVQSDSAFVYERPDFDSPVLREIPKGTKVLMSNRLFGAFYRVQLADKSQGFVTDVDLNPQSKNQSAKNKTVPKLRKKNFRGLKTSWISFREDTMESKNQTNVFAFGVQFLGTSLFGEGSSPFDASFLLSWGAPQYYKEKTGRTASGYLFLADGLFSFFYPTSKTTNTSIGFGPMLKYSKFNVSLPTSTGSSSDFTLEDFYLGVAIDVGAGARFGDWLVRADIKYYIERTQYPAFALAVLYGF